MVKILTFLLMVVPTYGIACQNKVDMLAKNIYFEARGEGRHGMRLVADVTLNRVKNDDFPDTICAVVMQKGQFTWNKKSKPTNQEKWELALDVANSAIKEGPKNKNILYFKRGKSASWQNRSRKIVYKNHSFY